MKIALVYPPFEDQGRVPLWGQNRQFRFSSSREVRIFPLVPATAATWLAHAGHEVLFLDGVNRRLSRAEFDHQLNAFNPDLIALESKAPLMPLLWDWIRESKDQHPRLRVALYGDHVSWRPAESMDHSPVDFVIRGGDYDATLVKLAAALDQRGDWPAGVLARTGDGWRDTGDPVFMDDLDHAPFIDRELTHWDAYGEAYLLRPVAYILSGRGCGRPGGGGGVCRFCVWQRALWGFKARLRSPANFVHEIKELVERYHVREIFDDNESGGLWDPDWMAELVRHLRQERLLGRVILSSNARADTLTPAVCRLARQAGYRLLKVGLESGNDETLRRLNKLETIADIKRGVKTAKDAGLRIMLTSMVGYPWETEADAARTLAVARELMLYRTRFGDSLQSSIVIPYPGTELYDQAVKEDWFLDDVDPVDPASYRRYDMAAPLLKCPIDALDWCQRIWNIHKHPLFMLRSALTLDSWREVGLAWRGMQSLAGHTKDL